MTPAKENVPGAAANKEGHADIFCYMKRPTVKNTSNYHFLMYTITPHTNKHTHAHTYIFVRTDLFWELEEYCMKRSFFPQLLVFLMRNTTKSILKPYIR